MNLLQEKKWSDKALSARLSTAMRIRPDFECNAFVIHIKWAVSFIFIMQMPSLAWPQSASENWPDNIIITKRLVAAGQANQNKSGEFEAAAASICAQAGKTYEKGTMEKVFGEQDFITEEITYLSGRKKLVITESLMSMEKNIETCVGAVRLGTTYDYTAPGEAWTVVRSPRGVYSPERHAPTAARDLKMLETLFRNREKDFQIKWRQRKYSKIESFFGYKCGYPINPKELDRPAGMGKYGEFYDKAVAAVQSFHQDGPKLCSLVESPIHVGTGQNLVLHVKDIYPNYDDETGCVDTGSSEGLNKKKCFPIVVDFKINAAMPIGIFEKPIWAKSAGSRPN